MFAIIAFPIALVLFAFSSCDVRKRSEKHACKAGKLEQCLDVAQYYDNKQGGIISFLMSHADTAIAYYFEACKLQSSIGCDRMMYVFRHGEQAKNLSTDLGQMADALIDACRPDRQGMRQPGRVHERYRLGREPQRDRVQAALRPRHRRGLFPARRHARQEPRRAPQQRRRSPTALR